MKLILLIPLAMLSYWAYQHFLPPAAIAEPVYVEMRLQIREGGRDVEAALFGRASDDIDCQLRLTRARDHLRTRCPQCRLQLAECKPALAPRYLPLFDERPGNLTYFSYRPSRRGERDVRMIFWGLTVPEANHLCDQMRNLLATLYAGPSNCIRPAS